jgi:2',3'-cyclic-nucleotide 2'-phosphodiesterase (5'-nucleotidase family)
MATSNILKTLVKFCWVLAVSVLVCCAPATTTSLIPAYQLLPIDNSYTHDSLSEATIAPYREQMTKEMDVVIGHADKWLVEGELESLLGNFVTDALLVQSRQYYSGKVHMSLITNGGMRAPIPQGEVKISNIYELMPFENFLYILELDGSQTKSLFSLMASDKRLAVANTVVLVEEDEPVRIFIDGEPFDEKKHYILAVSDYLANGGGGMEFLKQARVLQKFEVKIRDMIIDHIRQLESQGKPVDAMIEGRVKLMP